MNRSVLMRVLLLSLLMGVLVVTTACGDTTGGGDRETTLPVFTVVFDSAGGTRILSQEVTYGGNVKQPADPELEGYVFGGWMQNAAPFDFENNCIYQNLTLTAKWIPTEDLFRWEHLGDPEEMKIVITGVVDELPELTTLIVPKTMKGFTVVGIGEGAFANITSTSLQSLSLPDTVTSVGKFAFSGLSDVIIRMPGTLTEIGEGAFKNCNGLASVTLGEPLSCIPYDAFAGCSSLTTLQIPDSVTVIQENAFEDCASLLSVILPQGLERIEDSVFVGCAKLKNVYTMRAGEPIADTVLGNNSSLLQVTVYYYTETRPQQTGNFWYMDQGTPKIWN